MYPQAVALQLRLTGGLRPAAWSAHFGLMFWEDVNNTENDQFKSLAVHTTDVLLQNSASAAACLSGCLGLVARFCLLESILGGCQRVSEQCEPVRAFGTARENRWNGTDVF